MIIQKYNIGDYNCVISQVKLGYTFKIYYPLNGKRTCVARSYCYFNDFNICKEKADAKLNELMCVVDTLF